MPYIYKDAMKLEQQPKVGDAECVALVRTYAKVPSTSNWRAGKRVMGDRAIALGTAIATFDDQGKWPHRKIGNHGAFYLSQTSDGMRIIDQWNRDDKKTVSARRLKRLGKNPDGSFVTPSDNADAFSVIE